MSTLTALIVDETRTSDDDDLDHYWCCDEAVALCSADISGVPEVDFLDDSPDACVVCRDLVNRSCARCGL